MPVWLSGQELVRFCTAVWLDLLSGSVWIRHYSTTHIYHTSAKADLITLSQALKQFDESFMQHMFQTDLIDISFPVVRQ
jgi:hypothetical protein